MASIGAKHSAKALAGALAGKSTRAIAADVGVTHNAIAVFLRSPEAKSQIEDMKRARNEEIGRMGAIKCLDALEVLTSGLKSEDQDHQLKCALQWLDRFGFERGSSVNINATVKTKATDEATVEELRSLLASQEGQQ